jgi:hypothetical protein
VKSGWRIWVWLLATWTREAPRKTPSAAITGVEENLESGNKFIVDAKTALAHRFENAQWIVEDSSPMSFAEHTQRSDQRQAPALDDGATLPFVHDHNVGFALDGKLDGFSLAEVEHGQ